MSIIRLTKVFSFAMAHALEDYHGMCKNIHGHTYKLEVTVTGKPDQEENSPKQGMIIDFSDLKKIIEEKIVFHWDHALMLNRKVNPELLALLQKNYERIILVNFQPTTENMICYIAAEIKTILPPDIQLYSIRLKETENSYATWFASENE